MAADLELPPSKDGAPPIINELDEAIMHGRAFAVDPRFVEYVPATIGEAEEVARRLAILVRRKAEIDQQYKVWKAELDGWRTDELDRLASLPLYERWLEQYGLARRREEPKRATFALPSAKIATRQAKEATVEVDVEEQVIAWAREALSSEDYERVVATTESVRISELRKLVNIAEGAEGEADRVVDPRSGAIVPGVVVSPASTTAKVTPNT